MSVMAISSFISKLLLTCCLVLLGTSAFALDIPRDCSDLEMLQHKWETQYFYDLKFNGYVKTSIPELKCDTLLYKFVKAIWAIENLKTSPEFGNIYEQLKTHVREFRIMPLTGIDGTVLCGNTTTSIGRIALYLCAFGENEKKESYPWKEEYYIRNLLNLVATIVHELVHIKFPQRAKHLDCNRQEKACDYTFEDNSQTASPFSFEILYIRDILRNNKFDLRDRTEIEDTISYLLENSFIVPVSE